MIIQEADAINPTLQWAVVKTVLLIVLSAAPDLEGRSSSQTGLLPPLTRPWQAPGDPIDRPLSKGNLAVPRFRQGLWTNLPRMPPSTVDLADARLGRIR